MDTVAEILLGAGARGSMGGMKTEPGQILEKWFSGGSMVGGLWQGERGNAIIQLIEDTHVRCGGGTPVWEGVGDGWHTMASNTRQVLGGCRHRRALGELAIVSKDNVIEGQQHWRCVSRAFWE